MPAGWHFSAVSIKSQSTTRSRSSRAVCTTSQLEVGVYAVDGDPANGNFQWEFRPPRDVQD
jgi:hypothetical protein